MSCTRAAVDLGAALQLKTQEGCLLASAGWASPARLPSARLWVLPAVEEVGLRGYWLDELQERSERPLVRNFTARVMYVTVGLLTGTTPPEPLLDEMLRADATSFMLIAVGDNDLEVAFNEHFADALDERATLWIVPGVTHTGAFSENPAEYQDRVITFLDEHLLRAEPAPPADER